MSRRSRRAWALGALQEHREVYGREVGERVRRFWSEGEIWSYAGARLAVKLPSMSARSYTLAVGPPSWTAMEEPASLDDAVSGPRGDWTHSGDFVPLFLARGSAGDAVIVARVADPAWVGAYVEGLWQATTATDRRMEDGVVRLADSLDAFLGLLKPGEPGSDDDVWAEVDDEGDDEDDEEA